MVVRDTINEMEIKSDIWWSMIQLKKWCNLRMLVYSFTIINIKYLIRLPPIFLNLLLVGYNVSIDHHFRLRLNLKLEMYSDKTLCVKFYLQPFIS